MLQIEEVADVSSIRRRKGAPLFEGSRKHVPKFAKQVYSLSSPVEGAFHLF